MNQANQRSRETMKGQLALCLILASLSFCCLATRSSKFDGLKTKIPAFSRNYKAEGILSLPYAELKEPFTAYFDGKTRNSRTDFYGDLYQVFQLGPNASSPDRRYGALYKLVWVPKSLANVSSNSGAEDSQVRRACFEILGSSPDASIAPQDVLPILDGFSYQATRSCPSSSGVRYQHSECELWLLVKQISDRKNTYKLWLTRDKQTNEPVPVLYSMLGYDSLLGSHYDRYDVIYTNYIAGGAKEDDFLLKYPSSESDAQKHAKCESMPGPGAGASSGARRAFSIVQNPLHELVSEPYNTEHIDFEHEQFKARFNRNYSDHKTSRRALHALTHNLRLINGHNRKLRGFKLAINQFADKNLNELGYLRGRLFSGVASSNTGGLAYPQVEPSEQLPGHWDWRLQGAVTPVKDQAVCGSCWSFGTSGAIEGAYFVQGGRGKLLRLSQQQMVDCSWKYGNNGCDGGEDFRAYKYVVDAGGLATEEDYGAYIGVDGKCHDSKVPKTVKLNGFYVVTENNVEALKHALINYGPVAISIDASRPTFTFYSHGVYFDSECKNSADGLDHLVLVVGFGSLDGEEYWLVKNSWSTYWGNDGYILMSTRENNCGVLTAPTVPIIIDQKTI